MIVYNTLTRQKEELVPLTPRHFRIYVCGPTVYNFFHLGNARPFITFDTLRRFLEYEGNTVDYVQNFTDIDDRMILSANDEGISVRELADRMIREYFTDADGLNIRRATHHPRATETIPAMIDIISILMDKGFAYQTTSGVYFDVQAWAPYGKLSAHRLDQLESGASQRVDLGEDKKNAMDFALWKFKKEGEPAFPSPWGEGRPGWHIECSAMARQYLGDTIDIHAGGQDLVFPHHENEIAQSEAATGKTFSRYWMHNGFVNVDHEKMAKSAGNFMMVRDLSKRYPYEVLRFFMLQAHYRMPINFTDELLDAAQASYERIRTAVANLAFVGQARKDQAANAEDEVLARESQEAKAKWRAALADDLNTAEALAALFELVRAANQAAAGNCSGKTLLEARAVLLECLDVLGLDPTASEETLPAEVLALVEQRSAAKKERDFALADRLRDDIQALGYKVEDTPQGPKVLPLH